MKKNYILLLLLLFVQFAFAQIPLPYTNDFNNPDSDEGWTHYAISGSDDWERGNASANPIIENLSWNTKLNGSPSTSSVMVLESPNFDLTNANLPYALSFKYQANINTGNLYLEYTLNDGTTWSLLDPAGALKKNWQTTSGFLINYGVIRNSAIDISSLAGNANVKFRFRFKTNSYVNGYGCILDDFKINPEYYNIVASVGEPLEISPLCPEIEVQTSLNFNNQYSESYDIETNYYLSTDTVFDTTDVFLGTKSVSANDSDTSYDYVITTPNDLTPGQYYIVYVHDYTDALDEDNEDDNVSYISLLVKPIFELPYETDFEEEDINWKTNLGALPEIMIWERGEGTRHHIEKSHSGTYAWHTSNTIFDHPNYTFQSVESPYINLNSVSEPLILSFWYKAEYPSGVGYYDNEYTVQYQLNCNSTWQELYIIPENDSDDWEYLNISLDETISTNDNVRFRITYRNMYLGPEGIVFDDFYVGPNKPDLSIENIYGNDRYTSANNTSDVLKYQLRNSGQDLSQSVNTNFYWSNDNSLDSSDILLGSQAVSSLAGNNEGEWIEFNFTKPTLALGDYFIIYDIDSNNSVDELRENNNIGYIPINQSDTFDFPYFNDFESNTNSWYHNATLGIDDWEYSNAQGEILNETFSGTKAFITKPSGIVSPMSRMHLYTPIFDLSNSINPVLEFDMKLDNFTLCHCFEFTLNMSYSIDNGATWTVLNPINDSFSKWDDVLEYYEASGQDFYKGSPYTEVLFAASEPALTNYKAYNSRDIDRNTKFIINIPQLKDETNVRFRFNAGTFDNDGSSGNGVAEGALIDNFQIREAEIDLQVPYTKNLYLNSDSEKINFSIDVKNAGNFISNPTNIKFYLSEDDSYDVSDNLIGEKTLSEIRPDTKSHNILEFDLPSSLSDYSYLVYVIDDINANIEFNEANNIGSWLLGLQGISSFPYIEDFEDDVINGWNGYAYYNLTLPVLTSHRVTNRLAVNREDDYYRNNYNGILRTEYVAYGSWQDYLTPLYYIVSPTFDFTSSDTSEPLFMSFDLMSVGKNNENGSNMEYSIDGGDTWILLTQDSSPTTSNWYRNIDVMSDLDEPGWFESHGVIFNVNMDISFLQNENNVNFRYKFYSNFALSPQDTRGFRLDNFVIAGESILNDVACVKELPYEMTFDNYEAPCWSIDGVEVRSNSDAIEWEIVDNFSSSTDIFSTKIDIDGLGDTDGSWLVSPLFNVEDETNVSFNMALTEFGNNNSTHLDSDDQVQLSYTIDNGVTWTSLRTWNNTSTISNTGQLIEETISHSGHIRLGFWASNGVVNDGDNPVFYVSSFNIGENALSVDENENSKYFQYYPNPVNNLLLIESEDAIEFVTIYDLNGKVIKKLIFSLKNNVEVDAHNLSAGMYFVKVKTLNGHRFFKIIK